MNEAGKRSTRSSSKKQSAVKSQALGKSPPASSSLTSSSTSAAKGKGRAIETNTVPARPPRRVFSNKSNKTQGPSRIEHDIIDISSDAGSDAEEIEIIEMNTGPSSSKSASSLALTQENARLQSELKILRAKFVSQGHKLKLLQNKSHASPSGDALKDQIESISSLLSCQICFETFGKPFAVNPCGHEFCGKCLKDWFENSKRNNASLECPTCRTLVEGRPIRNYTLGSIIDAIAVADKTSQAGKNGIQGDPGLTNDRDFWRNLFPTTRVQQSQTPTPGLNANAHHQAGLVCVAAAVPPGWVIPVDVPVAQLPPHLALHQNPLLRRGVPPRMMEQLPLTYSDDYGICGNVVGCHVHFGWVFPDLLRPYYHQSIRWDVLIQTMIANIPYRWAMAGGCAYLLLPA